MSTYADYPIALEVIRFLEGDAVYGPAAYEPIKDWLDKEGLLSLVQNPLGQNDEVTDPNRLLWYYNDAKAQVLFSLIRMLPIEVFDTVTDEQLTAFAKILQLEQVFLKDCCSLLEQVMGATQSIDYPDKEKQQLSLEAFRLQLASIDNLLRAWSERLPWLIDSERQAYFNEVPIRWGTDDAVFLYKQGLTDWFLFHPSFERFVGSELEHLDEVPAQVRPIMGRVVRFCQAMEADDSPDHEELLRRMDERLKAFGIELTELERLFCEKKAAYRKAFMALRSGTCKLDEVDQSLWDDSLVDMALMTDWSQIKLLKKPWLTPLRCEHAIALGDVSLIQYIPYEYQTVDIVDVVLKENVDLVMYVNPDCMTLDMAYRVAETKGHLLRYIPSRLITDGVAEKALRENVASWLFVPEDKRSVHVCQVVVELEPYCLSQVPMEKRTLEVCLTAVSKVPKLARYVPEKVWNDALFWKNVEKLGLRLAR